jgi:hypothetical protein
MATSKRKCCGCKDRFKPETMIQLPVGYFCLLQCSIDYVTRSQKRARDRQAAKARQCVAKVEKEARTKLRADKERIKSRHDWHADLQKEVNYYVKHILRKCEPCYTCDKPRPLGDADKSQAFHVGHYMPACQVDPRRFMLCNLRIQCYKCNKELSGNQAVYRKRLIEETGIQHVEWLECETNHKRLKEVFPHYTDIKAEIARYRKVLKDYK